MKILYDKDALKFIVAQDKPTRQRLINGIKGLTQDPPIGDIKKMQGYSDGRCRLRIGKYRVIYRFFSDGRIEILNIMDIDVRGDIYKHHR